MMEILKKFKTVVFTVVALFLYFFGYNQAKETAEKEQIEGELNAARNAKKVRDSLSDTARINRLHGKYKR